MGYVYVLIFPSVDLTLPHPDSNSQVKDITRTTKRTQGREGRGSQLENK
jgi:hypothetical protein